jgi:predicted GNAT family acetyltransferase
MQKAYGLTGPFTLNRDEPHFALDLSALRVPHGAGQIVPLAQAPADKIKSWIHAYMIEALNTPKAQADAEVFTRYDRYVEANSHVVLMDGSQPLAMCGFNARLPQIVQVGGVFTPRTLRGQGHARRALGQHLAQARTAGVQQAVLFAASDTAASTYRALGFEQIGQWTLVLLAEPQVIHG